MKLLANCLGFAKFIDSRFLFAVNRRNIRNKGVIHICLKHIEDGKNDGR